MWQTFEFFCSLLSCNKVLGIRFFVLKESKMMGVLYGSQNGDDGMMGGLIKYVMPH